MGTRADFYVGKGESSEWLGSIAWDGYPDGISQSILKSKDEKSYIKRVKLFLKKREDTTFPEQGWPWPWSDSRLTDFSYTFVDGEVKIITLGRVYNVTDYNSKHNEDAEPYIPHDKRELYFKDMSLVQNVTLGHRSGLLIVKVNS